MNSIYIYYIVAAWLLFIALTCGKKYPSAAILFLSSVLNIIVVQYLRFFDGMGYLDAIYIAIKYDGALGLLMLTLMRIDRRARCHAVILGFAVLCHSMLSLYLITDSSLIEDVSFLFYEYYDELIIMTALLQMWVSRDGMANGLNNAFRQLQRFLLGRNIYICDHPKRLSTRKERKGKV